MPSGRVRRRAPRSVLLASLVVLLSCVCACGGGGGGSDDSDVPPGDGRIAFGALEGGRNGLYVINPDGSGLQRLAGTLAPVTSITWSPDASRIAYTAGEAGSQGELSIYDFATGASTSVSGTQYAAFEPHATWSADSKQLAFVDATGGSGLLLRIFDVEAAQQITLRDIETSRIDWSPEDDGEIALVTGIGDAVALDAVNSDGSGFRRVVDAPDEEVGVRWSPDGGRITLWSLDDDFKATLFVVDSNGEGLKELASGRTPAWSPDGKRIAYSGPAQGGAGLDIYVIDADGGEPRAVAQSITDDREPSWAPNGTKIGYLGVADAQTAFVCVVQLEPESHDCFDLPGLLPTAVAWSPPIIVAQ